ncbi:FeoC-like transcriptional regulator [Roseburia hominis]|uniref:FeoC-like transcriptional regulator n=1 Tax=Roseburia hominis TaxID=301301 RepID=UPI00266C8A3B|nr:FeoC-like transcriptional regulator [Roseburia hominis]
MTYKENLCPSCIEQKLFREVKEYIRENDVNEYDVAQHFHIPHMQVKKWIREGRIEYKDDHLNTITMHCTRCGAPISFGTLCAKCMRQKDVSVHSSAREDVSDSRMRFIED